MSRTFRSWGVMSGIKIPRRIIGNRARAFEGDLGRIYGVQWRSWKTADGRIVDQLAEVIEQIRD